MSDIYTVLTSDGTSYDIRDCTKTAVTLNGKDYQNSTARFYAPTSAGTSGQLLVSNGSGEPSGASASIIAGVSPISVTSSDGETLIGFNGSEASVNYATSASYATAIGTSTANLTYSSINSALSTFSAFVTTDTLSSMSGLVPNSSGYNLTINSGTTSKTYSLPITDSVVYYDVSVSSSSYLNYYMNSSSFYCTASGTSYPMVNEGLDFIGRTGNNTALRVHLPSTGYGTASGADILTSSQGRKTYLKAGTILKPGPIPSSRSNVAMQYPTSTTTSDSTGEYRSDFFCTKAFTNTSASTYRCPKSYVVTGYSDYSTSTGIKLTRFIGAYIAPMYSVTCVNYITNASCTLQGFIYKGIVYYRTGSSASGFTACAGLPAGGFITLSGYENSQNGAICVVQMQYSCASETSTSRTAAQIAQLGFNIETSAENVGYGSKTATKSASITLPGSTSSTTANFIGIAQVSGEHQSGGPQDLMTTFPVPAADTYPIFIYCKNISSASGLLMNIYGLIE